VTALQPTDKGSCGHVFVIIEHQGHLSLKVIDETLQAFPRPHLDREEAVVLLEFPLRGKLVVECFSHVIRTPK